MALSWILILVRWFQAQEHPPAARVLYEEAAGALTFSASPWASNCRLRLCSHATVNISVKKQRTGRHHRAKHKFILAETEQSRPTKNIFDAMRAIARWRAHCLEMRIRTHPLAQSGVNDSRSHTRRQKQSHVLIKEGFFIVGVDRRADGGATTRGPGC